MINLLSDYFIALGNELREGDVPFNDVSLNACKKLAETLIENNDVNNERVNQIKNLFDFSKDLVKVFENHFEELQSSHNVIPFKNYNV